MPLNPRRCDARRRGLLFGDTVLAEAWAVFFLYIQRSPSSKHGHSSLALLAKNPCKGTEGVSKRTGGTSGKPWKAAGTAKAVNRTRAYDNTRCIVILPSPLLKTALLCRPLTTGT